MLRLIYSFTDKDFQFMNELSSIIETITLYFKGTYEGDSKQLQKAFHKDARITGIIDKDYLDWSLKEFIDRVTTKPTAAEKKEKYDKNIVFIDNNPHSAIVKARVKVGPLCFTDYITLLKLNNQWLIRNKSFVGTSE